MDKKYRILTDLGTVIFMFGCLLIILYNDVKLLYTCFFLAICGAGFAVNISFAKAGYIELYQGRPIPFADIAENQVLLALSDTTNHLCVVVFYDVDDSYDKEDYKIIEMPYHLEKYDKFTINSGQLIKIKDGNQYELPYRNSANN